MSIELFVYDGNDPKLKEKLIGMRFDMAHIDSRIMLKTDIRQHVLLSCKNIVHSCIKCGKTTDNFKPICPECYDHGH